MQSYLKKYNYAISLFEKGNIDLSKKIINELLLINPEDFNYYNFLGTIELKLLNFKEAINHFEKCIQLFPKHKHALYNLALCYENIDLIYDAIYNYKKVLEIDCNDLETLNNLGMLFAKKELYKEAEDYFFKCIELQPKAARYRNNLGNLYQTQSRFTEAFTYYFNALELDPYNCEIYYNISNCLGKAKFNLQSIAAMKTAIYMNPNYLGAMNNVGPVFNIFTDFKTSEICFRTAFKIFSSGKSAKAKELISKLDNKTKSDFARLDFSIINFEDFPEVEFFYEILKKFELYKSNAVIPDSQNVDKILSMLLNNMGTSVFEQGYVQSSIYYFEDALKFNYDSPEIHHNLSFSLLILGNFDRGWEEYEWRKKRSDAIMRNLDHPLPAKEELKNKIVFVHDEQGIGDSIQFCRYLSELKKYGCKIIYECWKAVYDLYKDGLEGFDELYFRENYEEVSFKYDFETSVMSLPLYFGTSEKTIPVKSPYIIPNKELVLKWNKSIKDDSKLNIGLAWAGNPNHQRDKIRSIPVEYLAYLNDIPDTKFYIIQKDLVVPGMESLTYDFINTAAIIENLDLVISIDTSIAHLAGAVGKKVWIVISYLADFRWLCSRDDSPWYPSMKIYRQKEINNWESILVELRKDLIKEVSKKTNRQYEISVPESNSIKPQVKQKAGFAFGLKKGDLGYRNIHELFNETGSVAGMDLDRTKEFLIYGSKFSKIFNGLMDINFTELYLAKAEEKIGYLSFINEIKEIPKFIKNEYSKIITSTQWCKKKIIEKGFSNVEVLPDYIDSSIFNYESIVKPDNLFIIFSDGKLNLQSGFDLIIKSLKIIQNKYPKIIFINSFKINSVSDLALIAYEKNMKIDLSVKDNSELMKKIFIDNGLDITKILTLGEIPKLTKREILKKCDIGIYLNRCSNTTNSDMMEVMATGKTVIASNNSGHKDILDDNNSYLLKNQNEYSFFNADKKLVGKWKESDLEEIISFIEFAYLNRSENIKKGKVAAEEMKKYSKINIGERLQNLI